MMVAIRERLGENSPGGFGLGWIGDSLPIAAVRPAGMEHGAIAVGGAQSGRRFWWRHPARGFPSGDFWHCGQYSSCLRSFLPPC